VAFAEMISDVASQEPAMRSGVPTVQTGESGVRIEEAVEVTSIPGCQPSGAVLGRTAGAQRAAFTGAER
jgi:hypothetical protein